MTLFEGWSVAIAAGALVVNAVLFVLVALQLRLLRRQVASADDVAIEESDRRRKEATLSFYASTLEKRSSLRVALPYDRDAEAIKLLLSKVQSLEDEHDRSVMDYLGHFELLATSVNVGVFDFETIARVSGGRIRAIWANYKPWVDWRRKIFGNERLYNELEALALRLEERNERLGYQDKSPSAVDGAVADTTSPTVGRTRSRK